MSATLTGPSTATINSISKFTVSQSAVASDTISISDGGAGGIIIPEQLLWSNTSQNQSFNYIPIIKGTTIPTSVILTLTDSSGNPVTGSPLTLTVSLFAATSIRFTGPSVPNTSNGDIAAVVGTATSNFTITPNGILTGTIVPIDMLDGIRAGGTFTPSSFTFSSSTPQTFTYTPAVLGKIKISLLLPSGFSNVQQFIVDALPANATTATLSWTAPTGNQRLNTVQAGLQVPTPFLITLNGQYQGTFTLSDGGAGGTFYPSNKIQYVNPSNASTYFYYTPPISTSSGSINISISASPSLTISGSPVAVSYAKSTPSSTFGTGVVNPFYQPNSTNS